MSIASAKILPSPIACCVAVGPPTVTAANDDKVRWSPALAAAGGSATCPAGWGRRLGVAALLLLLAATLLLYRLCYATAGATVCAPNSAAGRLRFPHTQRRLPAAIIIGVRKGGTRALLEMINIHPQVMRASREVHFFDRDENYRRGLEWYRKRMPFSFDDQVTVEKSPSYFVTPTVPGRVYQMNPSVRLIVVVREPVTRLISDYTQYLEKWAVERRPIRSLAEMVLRPDGSVRAESKLVKASLYQRHLKRWLEYFPRAALLVVDGDRLISDPLPEVRRVESHLHLQPYIRQRHFYFNSTKGFYCITADAGVQGKCLSASKGRKHPDAEPALLDALYRFFAPHNRKFFRLMRRNFSWPIGD
ncbi:heparan sulfate glucosamine 3-O-sulfotransferase 1-like [Pollicipes pollicipes]|uniref:heparan sulfate glucosamine 3-O-sulfotransferase 1-like n=1 Tax=Pollicipes pollicipes TaxID=41117 RepID=UPI001884F86A|nr:heparan sulfate glucosamine 3-O-sulfotransferase 1-like [Pollicipes pollicipes]